MTITTTTATMKGRSTENCRAQSHDRLKEVAFSKGTEYRTGAHGNPGPPYPPCRVGMSQVDRCCSVQGSALSGAWSGSPCRKNGRIVDVNVEFSSLRHSTSSPFSRKSYYCPCSNRTYLTAALVEYFRMLLYYLLYSVFPLRA